MQERKISRGVSRVFVVIAVLVLAGCTATHTMVKKRNLDVQTKMSETIFLEPVGAASKVVFLEIRNTSDKDLVVKDLIAQKLTENGYKITQDPNKANFMLQANILQMGKSDLRAAEDAYRSGYGGAIAGAAVGGVTTGSWGGAVGGGLIGSALSTIGDALVDDTFYSMITDLQIRERPAAGEVITQEQDTNARQGSATNMKQKVSGGTVNWKTYRTRVVSTANKANLKFEEAKEPLESGLVKVIGGIL